MNKLLLLSMAVFSLVAFNSNASSINEYGEEDLTLTKITESANIISQITAKHDYNDETHESFGAYTGKSC